MYVCACTVLLRRFSGGISLFDGDCGHQLSGEHDPVEIELWSKVEAARLGCLVSHLFRIARASPGPSCSITQS
eukprot:1485885-Alexandrium_andersonii.AAC.1